MWNRLKTDDFKPGTIMTSAMWNDIFSENMNYVKTRSAPHITLTSTALYTDYTASHQTYMDYIDETDLSLPIFPEADDAITMVLFAFSLSAANTQEVAFDIDVDGDKIGRHMDIARIGGISCISSVIDEDHALLIPLVGLTPGEHTIKPVWAMRNGGGATINIDKTIHFGAWELT